MARGVSEMQRHWEGAAVCRCGRSREGEGQVSRQRDYDSTVARIAGNLLSGHPQMREAAMFEADVEMLAHRAVWLARAIVAETKRTEPKAEADPGESRPR